MELAPKQQTVELIKKAKNILIVSHKNPDGDALGSMLALKMTFEKMNKTVVAAAANEIAGIYRFLPKLEQVESELHSNKDLIIQIDLSNTTIERLGYKKNDEEKKLNIVITPKEGIFSAEDVQFVSTNSTFDLIFVLDAAELDLLGEIYDDNTELFYETPVINIDHHPSNDYFGKVNWIDITATSTSEIIVGLVESLGRDTNLIDPEIATCLLAGITTDTGSFQNTNTTPKSLTIAAQLVAAGARQQDIIKNIYKTRPLTTLKVWGKILENIHEEKNKKFIWSEIDSATLLALGAQETEIGGVLDELKSAPEIDFALLLSERSGGVHGSFRAAVKGVNVAALACEFGGGGHEAAAAFDIPNTTLRQQRDYIISKIKEIYSPRTSIK